MSQPRSQRETPCRRRRLNKVAMKDDDLKSHVAAEFSWDPQVDSDAIEVSAASGTVTLRGDRG